MLAPLIAILASWVWLVLFAAVLYNPGPSGAGMGFDFAVYYAAAKTVAHGGDVYDPARLYRTEHSILHAQGLPITDEKGLVRVGEPPVLFWAMRPLTVLGFQPAAVVWIFGMLVLSALGFLGTLHYLGWRRRVLPTALFLAAPPVVDGVYYANDVGLMVGALGCALALLRRNPMVAGLLLIFAWVKPQVALPLAVLIIAFHPEQRRRLAAGFLLGTAGLGVLTLVGAGPGEVEAWVRSLVDWSREIGEQYNIASLAGLYLHWAPYWLRVMLSALTAIAALGASILIWRQTELSSRIRDLSFPALWCAWFLAAPYAHNYDEALLALPVLALVGRDGRRIGTVSAAVVLYGLVLTVILTLKSLHYMTVMLFPLPVLFLAGWLFVRLWQNSEQLRAQEVEGPVNRSSLQSSQPSL